MMKRYTFIVVLYVIISIPLLGKNKIESKGFISYEGSVSLVYTHELTLGLSTVHGVRLSGDRWFIGGAASIDVGLPYGSFHNGSSMNAGFRPRWFFADGKHLEAYVGCGVGISWMSRGRVSIADPDEPSGPKSYGLGPDLVPELGMGIRLGNGDVIDVAILCNVDFLLSGTFCYRDGRFTGPQIRPGVSVGYRF